MIGHRIKSGHNVHIICASRILLKIFTQSMVEMDAELLKPSLTPLCTVYHTVIVDVTCRILRLTHYTVAMATLAIELYRLHRVITTVQNTIQLACVRSTVLVWVRWNIISMNIQQYYNWMPIYYGPSTLAGGHILSRQMNGIPSLTHYRAVAVTLMGESWQ